MPRHRAPVTSETVQAALEGYLALLGRKAMKEQETTMKPFHRRLILEAGEVIVGNLCRGEGGRFEGCGDSSGKAADDADRKAGMSDAERMKRSLQREAGRYTDAESKATQAQANKDGEEAIAARNAYARMTPEERSRYPGFDYNLDTVARKEILANDWKKMMAQANKDGDEAIAARDAYAKLSPAERSRFPGFDYNLDTVARKSVKHK